MRAAVPAFLVLLAASPALGDARTIEPGYWETTNRVLSPIRSTKTERRCIRPADVAKFMEGPGNHIYVCTYPTRSFRNGQIVLRGSCKSRDKPPFPIEGQGTYTAESFRLDAHASPSLGPIPLPIHAVTEAHRLGDACPPPAPATPPSIAAPDTGGNSQ
jgi:hypothetical protein